MHVYNLSNGFLYIFIYFSFILVAFACAATLAPAAALASSLAPASGLYLELLLLLYQIEFWMIRQLVSQPVRHKQALILFLVVIVVEFHYLTMKE